MIAILDEYKTELSEISGYTSRTVGNYVNCMALFIKYLKEQDISFAVADGTDICKWITELKSRGLSYSRLEHHRSALKIFYSMLVKFEVLNISPAAALPRLKKNGLSTVMPVSKNIVMKLLNIIDRATWIGMRNYLIVSMLWALGLRISELTRLTIGSFEPGHGDRIGLLRVKGKNKKQRALFVVDNLYDNLMVYISHLETLKLKKSPMFQIKSGKAMSNNRIQKKLKEYCKTAGITQRLTPHVLRHSFATEMYHAGVPLNVVQAMMGHSKKAETALYIKVSDKFKQQALQQLAINERWSWE